jgi:hypothetical protein
MKQLSLFLGCVIFALFLFTEYSLSAGNSKYAFITARNGLRMRSKPSIKGKKVLTIPYNMKIPVIETTGKDELIAGRKGRWIKTKWSGTSGWVFSGFITYNENNWKGSIQQTAQQIAETIKNGPSIKKFIGSNGFTLVYYRYSRFDGNTDGSRKNLSPEMIDGGIDIKVTTDGKGWANEGPGNKPEVKTTTMKFLLMSEIGIIRQELKQETWFKLDLKKGTLSFSSAQHNLVLTLKKIKGKYRIVKIRFEDVDPG